MVKRFLEEYRHERALIRAKIIAAGYDPDAIILLARWANWMKDVRHAFECARTNLRDITKPEDIYRQFENSR